MTDPGSVAAAYAIVAGGLLLYVASIGRRVQAARRTSEALQRERERDLRAVSEAAPSALASTHSERPR